MACTGSPTVLAAMTQIVRNRIGKAICHFLPIVVEPLVEKWCLFALVVVLVAILRRQESLNMSCMLSIVTAFAF